MFEDYVRAIVEPIIESPSELKVTTTKDDMGVLISIDVLSTDMGSLIGRNGDTAKAIRHLMRSFGSRHNARISLKINEPTEGKFAETSIDDVLAEIKKP